MLIYNQNNITTPGIDIAGVASSILATPTIKNPASLRGWRGFYMLLAYGHAPYTARRS
jgi:hypothetical protein